MRRFRNRLSIVLVAGLVTACGPESDSTMRAPKAGDPDEAPTARARRLLSEVPLTDGHNDLPWQYRAKAQNDVEKLDITKRDPRLQTDLPKLAEGGLGAQFWSVYVPVSFTGGSAVTATMEQIDVTYRMVEKYPDRFGLAFGADDIERCFKQGRIASLFGIEGGHCIDGSLGALRMFYRLGVRYMTLTHSKNTPWADACTDDGKCGGLSEFGRDVVREMNRLGMLVDISHVSPETMRATLDVTRAPVIFSHSSARALCDHVRNVPDDVLKRLATNGGLCMVTFVPQFLSERLRQWTERRSAEQERLREKLGDDDKGRTAGLKQWEARNPAPRATLADAADHIEHVIRTAGADHVGIGGDFDGIAHGPDGLEDVSRYADLVAELIRRGHDDDTIRKLLGENLLRVFRAVEAKAAALQREEAPRAGPVRKKPSRRS